MGAGSVDGALEAAVTVPALAVCVCCARVGPAGHPAGWQTLAGVAQFCTGCAAEAIHTQEQARAHLPVIRREMAAIGLDLPASVRVGLGTVEELAALMPGAAAGLLTGVTEQVVSGRDGALTVRITVVAGLPPLSFGRSVAHEIGHAWLALRGRAPVELLVEEGLCELFAYAWLKRRGTAPAHAMRRRMTGSRQPVYGEGLRLLQAAVRRHGIDAVLGELLANGRLP